MDIQLKPEEARIIGCLLEKAVTTSELMRSEESAGVKFGIRIRKYWDWRIPPTLA
jgi:hypothetical protein